MSESSFLYDWLRRSLTGDGECQIDSFDDRVVPPPLSTIAGVDWREVVAGMGDRDVGGPKYMSSSSDVPYSSSSEEEEEGGGRYPRPHWLLSSECPPILLNEGGVRVFTLSASGRSQPLRLEGGGLASRSGRQALRTSSPECGALGTPRDESRGRLGDRLPPPPPSETVVVG